MRISVSNAESIQKTLPRPITSKEQSWNPKHQRSHWARRDDGGAASDMERETPSPLQTVKALAVGLLGHRKEEPTSDGESTSTPKHLITPKGPTQKKATRKFPEPKTGHLEFSGGTFPCPA